MKRSTLIPVIGLLLAMTACTSAPQPAAPAQGNTRPKVVATTTLVGDVVRQVGGDAIDLTVLLPVGADPHGFDPTPRDVSKVADADVVFINGLGLEQFLERLLASAGSEARVVAVSEGIAAIETANEHAAEDQVGEAGVDASHADEGDHEGDDPHVWTDPNNVLVWTANVAAALSQLDPANAAIYEANAQQYAQELQALDAWVREQVAQVPTANRNIVTDHAVFGYFAQRYGFEQVGTIVPGYSTLAEPSAQELAALEDAIRSLGVKAVFVGQTVNPGLAQRVADDTATQLALIYTGSLGQPGGEAGSYLDYIRYNVSTIVEALR
ncbi:MAG TPA: metal ABC transporter substrate-binding protein [Anaerolineae bacterium]|nr:metal ABC transporter substrate-binding protein [Anaerolineae bacterium]